MTITFAPLSLVICLVGLIIYCVASWQRFGHPPLAEIGRIMFAVGMFVYLLK